ncbi:MAG: hypothetical protein IJ764_06375 [Bacteroidales bacterium]|nr:hypothetical protein [Bacteroidales bacterium]
MVSRRLIAECGTWYSVLRSVYTLVFIVFLPIMVRAQFEIPVMGGRGTALGGSSVALTDAASSLCNVAGLANRSGLDVAVSYKPNYLLGPMSDKWVAVAGSVTATGSAMASYHHFGNAQYSEQRLSIGYAQAVGARLSIGATIDYLYSGVSDAYYGSMQGLTFSAAIQFSMSRQWIFGAQVFNPAAVRMGSVDDSRLPSRMNIGVSYQPFPEWMTTIEVEKALYSPACIRAGVEYLFFDYFMARMGIASNPLSYGFGIGVLYSHYSFDLAASVHQTLGLTPMVGGTISF